MLTNYINKINQKIKQDKHFEELIKGAGTAFILRILGIISGYAFTLLVTRTLGAEAWGIFTLSLVLLQVGSIFGRLGTDIAILRFTAEYVAKGDIGTLKDIYKKILTLVIPTSLLVSIIVFFTSPILATKVFHKAYLTPYFKIIALAIPFYVLLFIHSEALRGLKKIKEHMFFNQLGLYLFSIVLFLLLGIYILYYLPEVSYVLSVIILGILSFYIFQKYLANFKIKSTTKKVDFSYILGISLPMFLSSSLALIMSWTDTIMLGIFRTPQEVGIYNVAFKLSSIVSLPLTIVNTIAAPKFAELWGRGDIYKLESLAKNSTKIILLLSLPIFTLFLVFPRYILNLFGSNFEIASMPLIILTFAQFINVSVGSVGYILQMTNKHKVFQNFLLISFFLNVSLNLVLIPKYNINGAAFSTAIALITWNILSYLYVKLVYKIEVSYF